MGFKVVEYDPRLLSRKSESGKIEVLCDKQAQALYLECSVLFGRQLPVAIERLITELACPTRFTILVNLAQYRAAGLYRVRSARVDLTSSAVRESNLVEAERVGDLLELVALLKQGLIRPEREYGPQIEAPAKTWQRLLFEAWTLLRLKAANLRWRMDQYASGS